MERAACQTTASRSLKSRRLRLSSLFTPSIPSLVGRLASDGYRFPHLPSYFSISHTQSHQTETLLLNERPCGRTAALSRSLARAQTLAVTRDVKKLCFPNGGRKVVGGRSRSRFKTSLAKTQVNSWNPRLKLSSPASAPYKAIPSHQSPGSHHWPAVPMTQTKPGLRHD